MEEYFKQEAAVFIGEYKIHTGVTEISFLKNMQASSSVQHRLQRDPTGSCLYRERATFVRMYDLHNG